MLTAHRGERIRTARLIAGFTQHQLATASGLSQALISQVESGLRIATDDTVQAVSEAVGMPSSFFNITTSNIPAGTMRFRKGASARVTETRRVEELTKEAWRVWSTLMARQHYPKPDLPSRPLAGPVDIESLAEATRRALGIDTDRPIGYLTRVVESHGFAVIRIRMEHEDDQAEVLGHFGVSCWPSPLDYGLVAIFPASGDRERFTIAHELGHLVLHRSANDTAAAEEEAHRFAGALLLPAARMEEAIGQGVTLSQLAELKARWGVSIQAIIMRGAQLGLLDQARKTSLFKQLSARGWRKREPVEVHREEPLLTWELLRRTYGPRPYHEAAKELGINELMLRSWATRPAA